MRLYAKVGSGPGRYIHVMRLRKPPDVGQHIRFKEIPYERWARERGAIVREIRDVHGQWLYCLELW